jgi:hypothetical protein
MSKKEEVKEDQSQDMKTDQKDRVAGDKKKHTKDIP